MSVFFSWLNSIFENNLHFTIATNNDISSFGHRHIICHSTYMAQTNINHPVYIQRYIANWQTGISSRYTKQEIFVSFLKYFNSMSFSHFFPKNPLSNGLDCFTYICYKNCHIIYYIAVFLNLRHCYVTCALLVP